jgi:hypothetical protein
MVVIGGEDLAQFDELRAELMEQYDPESALECELIERMTGLLWRLRRVPAFEAAIIGARQVEVASFGSSEQYEEDEDDEEVVQGWWARSLGPALIRDGLCNDALGKMARHEMLLLLQERRHSEESENLTIEAVALAPKDR